mmetsp:Transcript_147473/g.410817  ORF Transcript_147473/g.410817 Transcript_147473/m.410817 type:complete len:272 (-) Transcript_147473:34-849(-)
MLAFFWASHQTVAASSGFAKRASPHFRGPKRFNMSMQRGHTAAMLDSRLLPPSSSGQMFRARSSWPLPQYMQRLPVMLFAFSVTVTPFRKPPLSEGERFLLAIISSPSGPYAASTRSSGTNHGTRCWPSTRQAGVPCMPGGNWEPNVASIRSLFIQRNSSMAPLTRFSTMDRLSSWLFHQSSKCAAAAPGVTPGSSAAHEMATASISAARPARPSWASEPFRARVSSAMDGGLPSIADSNVATCARAATIVFAGFVEACAPMASTSAESQV